MMAQYKYGDETRAFVAVLRSYDWTDLPAMFERLNGWKFQHDAPKHWHAWYAWQNTLAEGRAILRADRQRLAREGK